MTSLEEKLGKVIHLITSGKIEITDELLLDKLLIHIKKLTCVTNHDEMKFNCNAEIISKIAESLTSITLDSSAKAFGMNVVGMVLKNASKSVVVPTLDHLNSLIEHWIGFSELPAEALASAAGLAMLSLMIANDLIVEKIIRKELISAVVSCLLSSNVYVTRNAQEFLSLFIMKSIGEDKKKVFPLANEIASELTPYLMQKLDTSDGCDEGWMKIANIVLPVVEKICTGNELFARELDVNSLLRIFACHNKGIRSKLCKILAAVVTARVPMDAAFDLVIEVLKDDELYLQKFSAFILSRSKTLSEPMKTKVELYLFLPLQSKTLSAQELSAGVEAVKEYGGCIENKSLQSDVFEHFCSLLEKNLEKCSMTSHHRLCICLLDCMSNFLAKWTVNEKSFQRILDMILLVLKDQKISEGILLLAMKNLQHLLKLYCELCNITPVEKEQLLDPLTKAGSMTLKFLCHPEWNVRDSAVELITQFTLVAKDQVDIKSIVINNRFSITVWEQIKHENESFVRASIFPALLSFSLVPEIWNILAEKYSEDFILKRVLSFASDDSEAIVRRAACKVLSSWFFDSTFSDFKKVIQSFMQRAIADLDWEVKKEAVTFWEQLFVKIKDKHGAQCLFGKESKSNHELDVQTCETILRDLNEQGWCSALLVAVDDYDICVKLQAAIALKNLKATLREAGMLSDMSESNLIDEKGSGTIEDDYHPETVVPFDSAATEDVLQISDKDTVEFIMQSERPNGLPDVAVVVDDIASVDVGVFLQEMSSMDLEGLVEALQISTDLHENLESLLDDLLVSVVKDETNAMDCY